MRETIDNVAQNQDSVLAEVSFGDTAFTTVNGNPDGYVIMVTAAVALLVALLVYLLITYVKNREIVTVPVVEERTVVVAQRVSMNKLIQ